MHQRFQLSKMEGGHHFGCIYPNQKIQVVVPQVRPGSNFWLSSLQLKVWIVSISLAPRDGRRLEGGVSG